MRKSSRLMTVAVCGPGEATAEEMAVGEEVGRLLAEQGYVVACGGLGGVMTAVSKGAKNAGGTTIGIIPSYERETANQWVDHVICTGMGQARNAILVATGEVVIAIAGGFGTLSEIGLALKLGRSVVVLPVGDSALLDSNGIKRLKAASGVIELATSPQDAVHLAVELMRAVP